MSIQSGNTGCEPVIEPLEPRLLLTVWPAMDWFEIDGDRWITYANTVTVGGDLDVDIKTGWSNSCVNDGPGSVTISFPGFQYLSSLGISSSDVSWTSDNGDGARTEVLKEAGDIIWTTWGQQAASHVLVEAGDTNWDAADGGGIYESQILEVTIHTPSTTQDIRVHVRGCIQDTDDSWVRNPYTLSPDGDQQGWPVYYYTIKVDADGPNAPETPYMYSSDDTGYRDYDEITSDRSPRFGWNQPSDPGGSGVAQYHWEIRTAEGSFVDDGYGASLEGQPDGDLGDGHYKIRVQAEDAVGNWGSWSSYLPFTIDGTEPSSPQPPVPSGETATLTPLIQWSYNSSYDWKYDVDLEYQGLLSQWYDVGGWPKVAERTGDIQASGLTWNMNYRVAVQQYDIAGNPGVYSAYTYFNTVDPNHAPTDILLSSNSVAENEPSG
ncbi:MAG: hypothetical protein KAX78_01810, partial [Phycisphaerae bacterium]|nr:hypothetical protein [Phycisphaerae bacterium]